MTEHLKDKVAAVTGGAGGICLLMAEEGAKVVVNDLGCDVNGIGASRGSADRLTQEIKDKGGTAVATNEDISTMEGAEKLIKAAVDNFGRLDILVVAHNTLHPHPNPSLRQAQGKLGSGQSLPPSRGKGFLSLSYRHELERGSRFQLGRPFLKITEQDWDRGIAVNLKGVFTCTKFASIQMRQQRGGRIIMLSSAAGLYGKKGQSNYSALPFGEVPRQAQDVLRVNSAQDSAVTDGIAAFTRVAARDLGRYGITVNCIASHSESDISTSNIAPVVTYLATDQAANINGQIFSIADGMISLMSAPERAKSIHKEGRWTYKEIASVFPLTIGQGLQ